jgi:hypothetical protein
MAQIVFTPAAAKTGTAPLTVTPSGLTCTAELYLGPDASTKTVTSGPKAFTSTGSSQNVACPVTMPTVGGTYNIYLNVSTGGVLIGAFVGTDTVAIPTVTVGTITWS